MLRATSAVAARPCGGAGRPARRRMALVTILFWASPTPIEGVRSVRLL